jgi:hypothetical protein
MVLFFSFCFLRFTQRGMNENAALSGLLKRKKHSIPLGVRFWAFYKSAVLENASVRDRFADKHLSLEEFQTLIKPLLKNSPSRKWKRSKKWQGRLDRELVVVLYAYHKSVLAANVPWTVKTTASNGLGIFAKYGFNCTAEHSKTLFGIVCDTDSDDFTVLHDNKYPSLFSSRNTGDGILFGPASLFNHSCEAMLRWSAPSTRGVPELFEGFNALRFKAKAKEGGTTL